MDKVIIEDLELEALIGVTEAERAQPQRLLVTVELERDLTEAGRVDAESVTARYDLVADLIREVVTQKPRKLIETVAADIAHAVLGRQFAGAVTVEVKKFSIPRSRSVSVRIRRTN